MNILLIGSGGREHALAWAISASPLVTRLYCAPGNAGIAQVATNVALDPGDHAAVIAFCKSEKIDFVVVGPEVPLVAGIVDDLEAAGIKCFGPRKAAAQLEGSKGFTKNLCRAHNIPTAAYETFTNTDAAQKYARTQKTPIVIKADGLAAGKGVVIAQTHDEADEAIAMMFDGGLGEAGASVVIEQFLDGEEASFFALCDGDNALALASAQDHKRAFDGDTGPNTGGMGAYSPAAIMTPAMTNRVMDEIIAPTLRAMKTNGMPFRGVLFAGLMIDDEGPKLIEYNVRFGDPETQVLMLRLRSDLLPALIASRDGMLKSFDLRWSDEAALTVVMAANGYPGAYEKGSAIGGLAEAAKSEGVEIFHAGTKSEGGAILATGGRVLNVCARGKDVAQAQARAYAAVKKIDWPGGFCRSDIGWRAIAREKIMSDLADLFPGFESHWLATSAGKMFARSGGKGPPLLLLHGYPQSNVMWHRVAPALAAHFTLVIPDLPGYGWSAAPRSGTGHAPYDKRSMANVMVEIMEQLGHVRFSLCGHDRGGRVAYRLAFDHPGRLEKLITLDIIPTYEMWHRMDDAMAMKVWHWPFLAQKEPLPEMLISKAPVEYLDWKMASWTKAKDLSAFDPRAMAHYRTNYSDPSRIHASCEDYRAGRTTDLVNDEKDKAAGNKIKVPLLALWGSAGIPDASGPLPIWRDWAANVSGHAIDSGHFPPEEAPDATAQAMLAFLRA